MVCVLLPREVWIEVLAVTLLVLNPQVAAGRHSPEHYILYTTSECYFENGTEHVRFMDRYFYNREEYVRFDSDVGKYVAVTELGRRSAEYWNSQKEILERKRGQVDNYCKHNYGVFEPFSVRRSVQPQVTVYPSKVAPPGHHNLLVCSVSGFYPGDIEVRWFLNGREETAGVVSTGLMGNGDWTYQTLVMLEVTPRRGDVYTCHVEHSSFQGPVLLDWRAQSESAQSKMLSGVGGLVLGLIFFGVGLIVHKRSQKGNRGSQPAGLLS
ncbi:H-2 class II histocompatibility antigen, E-S beta chain-like isoform X4 [Antechinus flavipes]|uniref:H-2 class II histocompatibility antigen, E-S beta chain-like isoform X1 n=1 Tax=Antechinus flavipes TaxID=38775 RepID=UPI0022365178|nr:H-2 class II histocompatibility antigen, E-S beta chain-like isoform X1 [Antechinus flavipes]XP_051852909.1 H-2 class II histocompatibility antigen, E-S beta chain-like isoform X2 [Antechinus flavipes]XP_051852910.1 H-2 class II histocompatibility antigen, E-S beta chain-like isoform X3 [Antechinus flavipes]XP_051852912.1 H-2 class II histocompatibility antigen, E-S beta chain-like isoform X4 [Antechinus flavipes]